MFEFGLAAMNGFCSGFGTPLIFLAVAAEPWKSGRELTPALGIGSAEALAARASIDRTVRTQTRRRLRTFTSLLFARRVRREPTRTIYGLSIGL